MCDIFKLTKITYFLVIILRKCYCDQQYKRDVDLIFSNMKDIRRFTFRLSNYTAIVGGLEEVRALDYDYASDLLFYILVHDQEDYFIMKTSINKPGVSTVVVEGQKFINSFEGISVDWVTKKIYFTDINTNRIETCQYDGELRRVLVSEKLHQPMGIALLPQEGFMFVADSGDSPKIIRFRMDGSHRKVLVELSYTVNVPCSIAVDTATNLVYWGDTLCNKIESMTTSGKTRSFVELDSDKKPYYITAFGGKVFWTNRFSKIFSWTFNQTVYEISSFSGSSISPHGIAVYSADKQPKVNTSCIDNGGCSHLCLLSKDISVCQCPTGVPLKTDKKSCSEIKKFLLVGRKADIRMISLDVEEVVDIVLPIKEMQYANGIDYDILEQMVYWTDFNTKSINRAFLNGTGHRQVVKTDIAEPAHLAIDWIARNLYWSDTSLNRIEVSRLDGSSRKIIVSENLIQPRGIAIDPVGGHIYWSVWGNYTRIERADLDGGNRKDIVWEDLQFVNGIAFYKNILYWADGGKKEIGMYDTIKKQPSKLPAEVFHPFAISVLDNNLYWTDWRREVTRFNIATKKCNTLISGDSMADVMGIKAVDTQLLTGYNPCHYQYTKCSHLCFFNVMKNASVCACPAEMELSLDAVTCIVPNGFLLYSGSIDGLKKLSIDTNRASKLSMPNSKSARLLEIYSNESRIFWLEETDPSTINSAYLNGSGFKTVVSGGLKDVNGLAIDWMAQNIYWINGRIEVAKLNGLFRKVLIYGEDILEPTLIVINPVVSRMYWFQRSLNGSDQYSLWQASLDGSDKRFLIKGIHPTSCSIDYKTSNVYWVHQNLQDSSIEYYDFNSSRRVLVYSGLPPTHALLVFQDSLIFGSHGDSTSIKKLSVMGKGQVIDLIKDSPFIHDIKVIHNGLQLGSNLCSRNNGGCEHLCFALSVSSRVCSCATHYNLVEDGRCFQPEHFLIFSYEFSFARVIFQDTVPEAVLPIYSQVKSSAIAFDEVRNFLYWLDSSTTSVSRVHQNGSGYESIKLSYSQSSILPDPYDFALDQFSNSIYWTDKNNNAIKFINLFTRKNGTILQESSYFPRKITVFPEHGSLFWTNEDLKTQKCGIMSTKISGVHSTTLLKVRKSFIVDIAIDFISHRLFWLDTDSIHSISLSGKDFIDNIVQNIHTPVALAVFGQYLFYADSSRSFIYKVSKENVTSQTVFHGKYEHLSSLVVVNLTRGKDSHPCRINNGGCSDICTINYQIDHSPLKSSPMPLCACPLFQSLVNGNTCEVHEHCNSVNEFFCKSDSLCINSSKKCDYKEDCANGEDELCSYPYQPCNTGFIACGNKGCIDVSNRCDGRVNCPHGEDEYNCDLCGKNQFHCKDDYRRCINDFQICDGLTDCFDASDEFNCKKKNNLTNIHQPSQQTKETSIAAGIISGVVVCIILLIFALFFFFRIRQSKKTVSREQEMSIWPMNQLSSEIGSLTGESNYTKSSISTYVSTMSKNTDKSFYDRNNVTGASSVVSDYSHVPLNPPPSPTTDRGFSVISDAPTTYDYTSCDQCSCQTGEEYDAPPPTLASLNDLELYCPINKHVQANWYHLDSISNNSHQVHNNSNKRVRSRNRNIRNNISSNKINGSHISGKGVSKVDSLQRQWLSKEESDLDSSYEREGIYGDVNNRLLIFDPPPTPCTNYLSEEERPSSDTETSVIAYGNSIRTHFAPPPSPVS
ncbi:low-density lipoprotein receptor-related protein 6 isoform X3 [Hydra vulgaris]|uniref:Low-density lipoprotein receptor-related protein 6 isoform X3 n=1 Tax=Hydra vulgaris TaxID=6087 RepID=A0ABM4BF48_HYDVU